MSHEHHDPYDKTVFGFWVYLLTDFIMFATLFAVYAVLRNNIFGGPSAPELFKLPFILVQTLVLLVCAFTSGVAGVYAHRQHKRGVMTFLIITLALGAIFFAMGMMDFVRLIDIGASWQRSGFLSGYFTLIGTHTAHIAFALLWVIVLLIPLFKENLNSMHIRRITCLRMFWQFLNLIWVFIYTIIYLVGVH